MRIGLTDNKQEGDKKTPMGLYYFGIEFGLHDKFNLNINDSMNYIKLNKNLYWVDDIKSIYYNKLVDITKVNIDWNSAEQLIKYPIEYEYAIEIKTNPKNIPGKRKCNIFTL